MKTKCGFFIASICLWATGASFAHPGGHGEAVQLTAWQSAANAPGDLQLALVIFCAVIAALLFALVKTRGTLQKLAVGGTAALLILYACSGGDSPTQSAPDAPETNDSAPPPSPDPETDDSATETPGIDDSTTETPSDPVTTPSGDALANDPTSMAAAFAPYTKVDTRFDDTFFYVESDGIPEHQMMVNITAWIAQVPLPHPYTGDNAWSLPLNPAYAENPISIKTDFQRGAIAMAA